jgi:hypothetical protein
VEDKPRAVEVRAGRSTRVDVAESP